MSLPNITVPAVELPIDIPLLTHPAVVHFVIAIPVVIILLELINLVFKKRALSIFSLFLTLLVAAMMIGAYFTGAVDAKEAYSLLSSAGQAELKEHKLIGGYLLYGSLALVVLKLLFMAFSSFIARLFFLLILIGFTAGILKQGHDGGELVYEYGANSEAIADIKSEGEDLQSEYEELEEKYETLEAEHKSTTEELTQLKAKASTKEVIAPVTPKAPEPEAVAEEKPQAVVTENAPEAEVSTPVPTTEEKEAVEENETVVEEATAEKVSTTAVSLEIPEDTNASN